MNEEDKDTPKRDATTGLCITASPKQPGLVVALVNNKISTARFDGYSDDNASSKKLLHDVFSKGDTFFNSGDLISRDEFGFFYWSDRVGDTFRWKGENVATSEVEHVLGLIDDVDEVVVYGVSIPNYDGKIGMAAITLKPHVSIKDISWNSFNVSFLKHLPTYSRPVFIRIKKQLQMTSTFKYQKNDLIKESYDPTKLLSDECLFFYNTKEEDFRELDKNLYMQILNGNVKF